MASCVWSCHFSQPVGRQSACLFVQLKPTWVEADFVSLVVRYAGARTMNTRVLVAIALLLTTAACADGDGSASGAAAVVKGGDERTGEYEPVVDWWKPAPDHVDQWTWGEVSGVAVDNPDRIIVAVWGDRDENGEEREGSSNYLLVVDRNGNITENWSQ